MLGSGSSSSSWMWFAYRACLIAVSMADSSTFAPPPLDIYPTDITLTES